MKAKKVTKKIQKNQSMENTGKEISELRKLAYIFCILLGLFLIFYGIAYLKAQNEEEEQEVVTEVIQYEEILANNIGQQSDDVYFVIVYHNEEDYTGLYTHYINTYSKLDAALNFYYVDMNNTFNSSFISDTNSLKDVNNLKISTDVLFKIENGVIIRYYTGQESIVKQLKALAKIS
ncbi:MAG: hypothetical protein PHD02_03485 [Bacilli bacterium]|nr:hypothetical protein [Bacilli bacterium]